MTRVLTPRKRFLFLASVGVSAPFTPSFVGLSTDSLGSYAQVGDHAGIGYTIDPDNGTETVKWSNSSDPADAATYGTGASPTDYTAGDGGSLWLHVTDGGETVSRSVAIRRAPGTGPTIADQSAWTVDDTDTTIDASASGTGLTFTYSMSGAPAGVTINASTGLITVAPTETGSGTITVTPEDQYGRTTEYVETFAWSAELPAVGTFGALTNQSFTENNGDQTYQHSAAAGTGLTFTYAQVGTVAGVTYNPATRTFTFDTDALAVQDGTTLQVSATDQYGRAATGSPRSFTFDITEALGQPVLSSVSITDAGDGTGTMTLTFDAGEPSGQAVRVAGYIDAPGDADPADGAAVAAGTGADGTFSVDTTVGATNVSVPITGSFSGNKDVFVAASYDDGSTWSNVVSVTGIVFDTTGSGGSWEAPTVNGTGDGSVTLAAGENTASAPSAPTIDSTGDGSVTLNAA